jgi:hypothetical protein
MFFQQLPTNAMVIIAVTGMLVFGLLYVMQRYGELFEMDVTSMALLSALMGVGIGVLYYKSKTSTKHTEIEAPARAHAHAPVTPDTTVSLPTVDDPRPVLQNRPPVS